MSKSWMFSAVLILGFLSFDGAIQDAAAGVGGKTYNLVNISNPLAPIRFLLPDQFDSPLGQPFGSPPGTWSQTDFGVFASWTAENEFTYLLPQGIPIVIQEQYDGIQIGPLLFALATISIQDVPQSQRTFLIGVEADE